MNKPHRNALWIALAIAVTGTGWFFLKKKEKKEAVNIQTATVSNGDILTTVTATGTVKPLITVEVGTQVSGEIAKIYVDYSSVVKKGQKLAELDRSTLRATWESAKAGYESAENERNYQQSNYERIKQLYEIQSVSKTDYETALYQYNNARNAYTIAKSNLDKAETNLGYATIYSPIDGVVLSRAVDEGQTVAASFSTPTMFTIAKDLTKMQVIANVDEADIGNVKTRQRVVFTVDAFPDDEFDGTVTMVRLEAQVSSNVVTYEVVIDAPNPTLKLLPGLTANVNIYTQEHRNVLIIPSKALRVHPTENMLKTLGVSPITNTSEEESNKRSIWVKKTNGSIEQRSIEIGINDGISTEVLNGLIKGETIVTGLSMSGSSDNNQTNVSDTNATSPFMPKHPGQKNKK